MRINPSTLLAAGLFVVFDYAGALKVLQPSFLYDEINLYYLIPEPIAWYMAHYLPWLEIIAGVACLPRTSRKAASLVLACLLVIFMGVLFLSWLRNFHFACGCFGATLESSSFLWDIGRDLIFLLCASYLYRCPPTSYVENRY